MVAAHPPPSPSQLCDMEGVAGGHVGRDLRLETVDVAAVAKQVAFQWITSVALFIIKLETTVLKINTTKRHTRLIQLIFLL